MKIIPHITQADFDEYHKLNPHVYDMMVSLARTVKNSGYDKYSIRAVSNRLRWHYKFEAKGTDPFKINNNYLSFYSALIMNQEEDLAGFFTTKKMKGE